MRDHILISVLFCLAASFSVQEAYAQGPPDGHSKMRKRIEDLRKVKLLDALNLQGDQVEKFFTIYNVNQDHIKEIREEIDKASKALQGALGEDASDKELTTKTKNLLGAISKMEKMMGRRFSDAKKVLTTKQFAQYVVFESRFRDELQRMILDRMRRMRNR